MSSLNYPEEGAVPSGGLRSKASLSLSGPPLEIINISYHKSSLVAQGPETFDAFEEDLMLCVNLYFFLWSP